jgi:hypothetical protein
MIETTIYDNCDTVRLALPSDRVSLRDIRRQIPDILSPRGLKALNLLPAQIVRAQEMELALAARAFARAAGVPDPHPHLDRDEVLTYLNAQYIRYGLSTGLSETGRLVKALEVASSQQSVNTRQRAR